MSAYPNAISPAIVGARRDGESVVLIVQCEKPSSRYNSRGASVRYEFRMSMGLAEFVYEELGAALGVTDDR